MRADNDGFAREMSLHVVTHLLDKGILAGGGEVAFLDVAGEDGWLVGQEKETAQDDFFIGRKGQRQRVGRLARVQVGANFFQQVFLQLRMFVRAFHVLGDFFPPLFDRFDVGQHQFGGDDFDVAHGIHAARNVHDVGVLEAADDMQDGVHLADMAQKLVAQAFAVRRAFHEARNVHEFNRRGNEGLGFRDFCERFEPRFRHGDDAEVRLDGAERVVLRRSLVRTGDGIEQRGFPDVGQTDDSGLEHNKLFTAAARTHGGLPRCHKGTRVFVFSHFMLGQQPSDMHAII